MKKTGLKDREGNEICIGHEVTLPSMNRVFKVKEKTVVRFIKVLEGFEGEYSKVSITGVVFEWNGMDLFPNVDENGIPDNEKMIISGTWK